MTAASFVAESSWTLWGPFWMAPCALIGAVGLSWASLDHNGIFFVLGAGKIIYDEI